jgi:hypothetical protein
MQLAQNKKEVRHMQFAVPKDSLTNEYHVKELKFSRDENTQKATAKDPRTKCKQQRTSIG